MSELRLDTHAGVLKGGKRGPAVVPKDIRNSLLLRALRHEGPTMPPGGKLNDAEIAAFEEWVAQGAAWPQSTAPISENEPDRYTRLVRDHWAFQPVRRPVINGNAKNAIDDFIAERLQGAGLQRAPRASRSTLVRRLHYTLTGLPPTADDVQRFVNDPDPAAYEKLVDRLLESPHFGEHWARHWMDLVRFAETRGYEWNYEIIGAWRYRDYLIRAFNADVPYDQLVREHIAGDLLEEPRRNTEEKINESVIGTAFYRLGEAGHDDCVMFREIALDVIDNQIDTLTKTFQGLTVSCARCHNHKLDPIPTEDYYGLYSILNSSRVATHTIDLPEVNAEPIARLRKLKADIRAELTRVWDREVQQVASYMMATRTGVNDRRLDPIRLQAWRDALTFHDQKLEDPGHIWASLARDFRDAPPQSAPLAESYRRESVERDRFNRENFEPVDLATWQSSGMGLQARENAGAQFTIAYEGQNVISGLLPAGVYSHLLSDRLNGALRSLNLPRDKKYISVRAMGGGLAAHRTVIDNCAIGEKYKVLGSGSPEWVKLDTLAAESRLPVFVELVTRWDNPRIPDRPGVLKPDDLKLLDHPRSWFGITGAVLHDVNETPRESLSHMLSLFDAGVPNDWEGLAQAYERRLRSALANWASGRANEDDVRWLDWLLRNRLLSNHTDASPSLEHQQREYRATEASIPAPRVVEGLADAGPGMNFPVLTRGDPKALGPPAPARFLGKILGAEPYRSSGSGRREMAEAIASAGNPLTARVMVNRIWHHIFGRGIVASVDNFGLLGDHPTHPELLDYLAAEFVENGWSIKRVIREIVLSDTFRQSGTATARAREVDPDNALLQHYPVRRLSAEAIRDSILMSSGKLKTSLYGPSLDPYRDQPKDYRRLFAGPLDSDGRRSLYVKITRMEGPRLLETFDYPSPMTTRGARDVTNVPAQSLALMNDPFVQAEAEACAARLLRQPAASLDMRIAALFRATLSREPTRVEIKRFRGLAGELASLHGVPHDETANSLRVLSNLAHTVFNLKEFIYVQ